MSYKILDERDIDLKYSSNSENAQSGKAVAEAIEKSKQNPILEYITYEIKENNTITITGCDTSISESHIIPNNIEGYLVSTIGESAFIDCSQLKNITIPNSITKIEKNAFYGCSKLKDIYYTGTKEEWYTIIIDIDLGNDWNDALFNATIHYNQVTSTKQDIIDSIDQVYSPTSKNAQSGIAVAEALANASVGQFKYYENLLDELVLEKGYITPNGSISGNATDNNWRYTPDYYEVKQGTTFVYKVATYNAVGAITFYGANKDLLAEYTQLVNNIETSYTVPEGSGIKYARFSCRYVNAETFASQYIRGTIIGGARVEVDQTYSPESTNAQSGIAVAEAVSGKADKEEWVLIDSATLEQDAPYSVTKNMHTNEPLSLKKFMILVWHEAKSGATNSSSIWLAASTKSSNSYKLALQSQGYSCGVQSTHRFDGEMWYYWNIRAHAAQGHYSSPSSMAYTYITVPYGCRDELKDYREPITGLRLTFGTAGNLNAGTRIEVWGVNA